MNTEETIRDVRVSAASRQCHAAVSSAVVRKSFWPGYPHLRSWEAVRDSLRARHPEGGRMLVFPTAPLALPVPG